MSPSSGESSSSGGRVRLVTHCDLSEGGARGGTGDGGVADCDVEPNLGTGKWRRASGVLADGEEGAVGGRPRWLVLWLFVNTCASGHIG